MKILSVILYAFLLVVAENVSAQNPVEMKEVRLEENGKTLVNQDMGRIMHFYTKNI